MTISNKGKTHIKRYLASFVPAIGRSIAYGIGTKAEAVGDDRLEFEVGRADVTLTTYDFVNNKLIFKATVPQTFGGQINEVALYSMATNPSAGEAGGALLSTFESASEDWMVNGTETESNFSSTFTRVGGDSLRQTAVGVTSAHDCLTVDMDLSGYSAADKLTLAFYVQDAASTGSVYIRLESDETNYQAFFFEDFVTGYNIISVPLGSATVVGSPNMAEISRLCVTSIGQASVTSQVDYDALRIEDADSLDQDYVMVAREVLPSTFNKAEGRTNDIEFALDVSL